jgi:uncharacterized protein DUF3489
MRTDTALSAPALSADQLLILATAARRSDRLVEPRPAGLRARGAVRRRLLAALLERSLVEEPPTKDEVDEGLAWRRDERGRHRALRLTPAGLAAVAGPAAGRPDAGAGEGRAGRRGAKRASPRAERRTAPKHGGQLGENGAYAAELGQRPVGKLGRVLEAVGAAGGATLAELVLLTGWRPHTTRAALTRLRQRGHALERLDLDGRRAYRLGTAR